MAHTSTHGDRSLREHDGPSDPTDPVRRIARRALDRPARIAWEVDPRTESLKPLRRAIEWSLGELDTVGDDVVLVASEIVTSLIALTDRPIDVEVARRNDELTLAVSADVRDHDLGDDDLRDDDRRGLDAWSRRVLDRLPVTIDDVTVYGDRRVVCTFGRSRRRAGRPAMI